MGGKCQATGHLLFPLLYLPNVPKSQAVGKPEQLCSEGGRKKGMVVRFSLCALYRQTVSLWIIFFFQETIHWCKSGILQRLEKSMMCAEGLSIQTCVKSQKHSCTCVRRTAAYFGETRAPGQYILYFSFWTPCNFFLKFYPFGGMVQRFVRFLKQVSDPGSKQE